MRVWTFGESEPPAPDETEPDLQVTTTRRNYTLAREPGNLDNWYPVASPANGKAWGDWLEFWGPLTEVV